MKDNDIIRAAKICASSLLLGLTMLSLAGALFKMNTGSSLFSGLAVFPIAVLGSAVLLFRAWTGR